MQANEFRIGNIVLSHLTREPVVIDWLALRHIVSGNFQSVYHPDVPVYEPIPLAPDILAKCGFEEWSEGNWKLRKALCLNGWSDVFNYYQPYAVLSTYTGNVPLEHLHQLQNIYFALTGKELQINL